MIIFKTLLLASLALTSLSIYAQAPRKMTMMFYLDNQNGDHVDDYVTRVQEKVSYYSQLYSKSAIQWITISNESNSQYLREQRLVIKTYKNGTATQIKELKGMTLSSPDTLNQFTQEGLKLGGDFNALFMVDHGFGDEGIMSTYLVSERGRELKAMRNIDVGPSILNAEMKTRKKVNVIVMDACLMGSIEAISDYLVGGLRIPIVTSENTTLPTNGGSNYDRFFAMLAKTNNSSLTGIQLGQLFVTANKGNPSANYSLIDLNSMAGKMIFEQFQSVQGDLVKLVAKNKSKIIEYLMNLPRDPTIQGGVYDLITLLETFEQFSKENPVLLQKLARLKTSLKQVILATENDNSGSRETGLSVRVSIGGKTAAAIQQRLKNYSGQSFAQRTKWDEIIKLFLSN